MACQASPSSGPSWLGVADLVVTSGDHLGALPLPPPASAPAPAQVGADPSRCDPSLPGGSLGPGTVCSFTDRAILRAEAMVPAEPGAWASQTLAGIAKKGEGGWGQNTPWLHC